MSDGLAVFILPALIIFSLSYAATVEILPVFVSANHNLIVTKSDFIPTPGKKVDHCVWHRKDGTLIEPDDLSSEIQSNIYYPTSKLLLLKE